MDWRTTTAFPKARGQLPSDPTGPASPLRLDNASRDSGSTAPGFPVEGQEEERAEGPVLVSCPGVSARTFLAMVTVPAPQGRAVAAAWRQACDACFAEATWLSGPAAEGRPLALSVPEVGDSAAALGGS